MGAMDTQGLYKFYFDELGWCGCGDPEGVMAFVGKVLDILNRRSESNSGCNLPYEQSPWKAHTDELKDLIGDDEKALMIMYVLDAHDLTEHGGNVMGCWLTDKGKDVLQAIKANEGKDWANFEKSWEFADQ